MRSISVAVPLCKVVKMLGVGPLLAAARAWIAVMRLPCSRSMATNGAMTARTLSLVDIAAEDSAEERRADLLQHLGAEVALDEVGYAFVFAWSGGLQLCCSCRLVAIGLDGGCAEEVGVVECGEVGGDHHAHAVGHGAQLAVDEDVGLAGRILRGEKLVGEAEFDGEFAGPGFFGHPAVGAALYDEAALAYGFDDAAEAGGGFE